MRSWSGVPHECPLGRRNLELTVFPGFSFAPPQWLRWIDRWIAYANSVVEE
jgi:hypothetical protein